MFRVIEEDGISRHIIDGCVIDLSQRFIETDGGRNGEVQTSDMVLTDGEGDAAIGHFLSDVEVKSACFWAEDEGIAELEFDLRESSICFCRKEMESLRREKIDDFVKIFVDREMDIGPIIETGAF